ncbi:unnamed protein product, partial [Ixodes hexagonus]
TKIGFGFSTAYLTEKIRPMGPEGPKELGFHVSYASEWWNADADPTSRRNRSATSSCLELGHRRDVCPYPEKNKCSTCGLLNGDMKEHECSPYCMHCKGQHPPNDPKCPARQREPYNKIRLEPRGRWERSRFLGPGPGNRWRSFRRPWSLTLSRNTTARQPLLQRQPQRPPPERTSQLHWPALRGGGFAMADPYAPLASAGPENYAAALTRAPGWNPGYQHFYHEAMMGLPVPGEH